MKPKTRKSYSLAFKMLVAEEFLSGTTCTSLAVTHKITTKMVLYWADQYKHGLLSDKFAVAFSKRPRVTRGGLHAKVNVKKSNGTITRKRK